MTDTPTTGGTVRYHRVEYLGNVSYPWEVWFDGGQGPIFFTAEQGEAMGLTPPAPAPLVVTCNGHRIELSDEEADALVDTYGDRDTVTGKLARLLRDARQDPQPASHDLDRHEREMCDVLKERDDAQEWADKLAFALGGPAIGEHSSMNNPWQNALDNPLQPAPLSPGECLRGLLAGRDDADELIEWAAEWLDFGFGFGPKGDLLAAVGDAAREVHGV